MFWRGRAFRVEAHENSPVSGWLNPWIKWTGWWSTHLEKKLVTWDDHSQYIWKKKWSKPPTRWSDDWLHPYNQASHLIVSDDADALGDPLALGADAVAQPVALLSVAHRGEALAHRLQHLWIYATWHDSKMNLRYRINHIYKYRSYFTKLILKQIFRMILAVVSKLGFDL